MHKLAGALVFVAGLSWAPRVYAQVDTTLSPTGGVPDVADDPYAGADQGAPAPAEAAGAAEGGGEAGFFFYDDDDSTAAQDKGLIGTSTPGGPIPEVHVVRSGDTLWDLCQEYFDNPWDWPRLWSLNPSITNPHWIYPGDLVRLREGSAEPLAAAVLPEDAGEGEQAVTTAPPTGRTGFALKRLAFVEQEQLDASFEIVASEEARDLLSYNDVVYLDYPAGKPPQVGRRYSIYSERKDIRHPDGGEQLGSFVNVVGELEVLSVKKGKRARAIVRASYDVLERGQRVGPLKRTFEDLRPTPNAKSLQGTIVAQLGSEMLIGARQIVFVDVGASQGVEPGNRMFIVRRGDAKPDMAGRLVGLDDERFPAYAIGEVFIVDVGERTSLGLVTLSLQESEVGDRVLMQKAR
jgi:hypothetical protein